MEVTSDQIINKQIVFGSFQNIFPLWRYRYDNSWWQKIQFLLLKQHSTTNKKNETIDNKNNRVPFERVQQLIYSIFNNRISQSKSPSCLSSKCCRNLKTIFKIIEAHCILSILYWAFIAMFVADDSQFAKIRPKECNINTSAHVHLQISFIQPILSKTFYQIEQPFVHILFEDINQMEDYLAAQGRRKRINLRSQRLRLCALNVT